MKVKSERKKKKTEWHQPKSIQTRILQGGAEMAGGMMANCQQAGRQPVTPVGNVDIDQVATSRSPRAMTRVAGDH